jgi:hypothetical protein
MPRDGAVMGYCGYTMFNALVNIEHLINKKARPAELGGWVRVGPSINENMPD